MIEEDDVLSRWKFKKSAKTIRLSHVETFANSKEKRGMNVDWKEFGGSVPMKEFLRRGKHSATYLFSRHALLTRANILHSVLNIYGNDCKEHHKRVKEVWRQLFSEERKRWKEREVGK